MNAITEPTAIMPVRCENEDCGMVSAYKFWRDGSFQRVMDACHHVKRFPTKKQIAEELPAKE